MSTEFELNQTPIEDWIDEGVSFLQAKVTLYRNPAIYAQYQPVLDQIRSLEAALAPKKKSKRDASLEESLGDNTGEEALGEDSLSLEMNTRLEELYAEAERLWDLYSKDVEVWTLRRIDPDEVQKVQKEMDLPLPIAPPSLNAKASPSAKTAHVKKFEKFISEMREYTEELNIRCLAIAVLGVVVKGEEKKAPSLEGLRRLKARPGGAAHIHELVAAMESLTTEGVNIMAPHRPGAGA